MKAIKASEYSYWFRSQNCVLVLVGGHNATSSVDAVIDRYHLVSLVARDNCTILSDMYIGLFAATEEAVHEIIDRVNQQP